MKNIKVQFLSLAILFLILGNTLKAQKYCDFVKKVKTYQDSVRLIKRNLDKMKPVEIDPGSFNINVYLKLFDKLSLSSELECHLYSNYDTDSGSPLLYVRPKTFNEEAYIDHRLVQYNLHIDSIISKKEIEFKKNGLAEDKVRRMTERYENMKNCLTKDNALAGFAFDSLNRACNHLTPEDSKLGYLQYLLFHKAGEAFALYWHSYYGEKSIICTGEDVKYYLDYYNRRGSDFSYDKKKIIGLLNTILR